MRAPGDLFQGGCRCRGWVLRERWTRRVRHECPLLPSSQGIATLRPRMDALLPPLFRLLGDLSSEISGAAAGALVNLSGDPAGAAALLHTGVCSRVMTHIRELTCPHHDMLLMLLSNITLEEVTLFCATSCGWAGEACHAVLLRRCLPGHRRRASCSWCNTTTKLCGDSTSPSC